jgi:DNA ligase-associated metallophosphoesterase
MQIELAGTLIELLFQRAIYLPQSSILIIGDLHLGKAMHFRKAGIFMPVESASKDYEILHSLILQLQPKEVYFLGDLFHSQHNSEWQQFSNFIKSYAYIAFTLIKGNHDILKKHFYEALHITVINKQLAIDNLIFSHEPLIEPPSDKINIAGHVHPGCAVRGPARQYLRLPCFYLKSNTFLLPAFGHLTGLHILDQKDATVFAILPNEVVLL